MKRVYLLLISIIFLFSCKKEKGGAYTETISKGQKWGLQIGASAAEVFTKLQQLGRENNFQDVAVIRRQAFSDPEAIQNLLVYYDALTLSTKTGRTERVIIEFKEEHVSSITAGGALPDPISKWPLDIPDQGAIHENDSVSELYEKLAAIYKISHYSYLELSLPDKTLKKSFDPDMANYNEWGFSFSTVVNSGMTGRSSVRLVFKDKKLKKIIHEYDEMAFFN